MSLIGSTFLALVAAVTVAAFVGLVVLWPRLHGHRPGMVAARAGLLLGVNLLVLLTAVTQLNAKYLFYSSWSDLAGSDATVTALSRGASAAQSASTAVRGNAAQASSLPAAFRAGVGRAGMITYTVHGPRSGLTGQIDVQLPPGYSRSAGVRYPVLETFGGYPSSPMQWIRTMRLEKVIASAVADHEIRPALIVSPQVEFPTGADTECVNGGTGLPPVETWLAQDVPDWIAHTFAVATTRSSWATIGLSAGGWCAGMLAMLHPAQYSAAVIMGGYFLPDFGPFYEPFTRRSRSAERYDLVRLAKKNPPPVAMWLETSHADGLSYASSAAFLHVARAPLAVHATVLKDAGHRIALWQAELPSVVTWLGTNIPGFRSTSVRLGPTGTRR